MVIINVSSGVLLSSSWARLRSQLPPWLICNPVCNALLCCSDFRCSKTLSLRLEGVNYVIFLFASTFNLFFSLVQAVSDVLSMPPLSCRELFLEALSKSQVGMANLQAVEFTLFFYPFFLPCSPFELSTRNSHRPFYRAIKMQDRLQPPSHLTLKRKWAAARWMFPLSGSCYFLNFTPTSMPSWNALSKFSRVLRSTAKAKQQVHLRIKWKGYESLNLIYFLKDS